MALWPLAIETPAMVCMLWYSRKTERLLQELELKR